MLAAFLPMLMIPVLAGGVTGGEALREGLVLLNTFWFSLCAGLWASARSEESFQEHWKSLCARWSRRFDTILYIRNFLFHEDDALGHGLAALQRGASINHRTFESTDNSD